MIFSSFIVIFCEIHNNVTIVSPLILYSFEKNTVQDTVYYICNDVELTKRQLSLTFLLSTFARKLIHLHKNVHSEYH